jgi:hypothetical protein
MHKPTKTQRDLVSRTAGRKYRITKLEGRRTGDWYDCPLKGNQILPRSLVGFTKENSQTYAIWMVYRETNGVNCNCESTAPAGKVDVNADASEIVLTGSYGRLTYQEIK